MLFERAGRGVGVEGRAAAFVAWGAEAKERLSGTLPPPHSLTHTRERLRERLSDSERRGNN